MAQQIPALTLTATWNERTKSWLIQTWVQRSLGVVSHSVQANSHADMERADARWLASALRDHLEDRLF